MQKITFVILIFSLIIVVCGQSIKSPEMNKTVESQMMQNKCSNVIEGLQFCTTTPVVSVKSSGNVYVDVSLQNKTDKIISVINGNLADFYNVIVTDSNNNKILTSFENLEKKVKEGTTPLEDLIRELPIKNYDSPPKVLLAPQGKINLQFNLSQVYDFKTKGKYHIEISRKIPKQNGINNSEISFGKIEVVIK